MFLTSNVLKIKPNRMGPCAFITTFWQFFDFILQISHDLKSSILGVHSDKLVLK